MAESMPSGTEQLSIGAVVRLTGLTAHTIRKWEQRYTAVEPRRTSSNRRKFSRADVIRLGLLRELTEKGHLIGDVARLPDPQLRDMLAASGDDAGAETAPDRDAEWRFEHLRRTFLEAVARFDVRSSGDALIRAAAQVAFDDLVFRVVLPILREVGERWEAGEFTVAQEHLVSNQMQGLLSGRLQWVPPRPGAPRVILATPEGQLHEFGVLAAALLCAGKGLQPVYLGPSLPEADLQDAVRANRAVLVVLSVLRDLEPAELGRITDLLSRLTAEVPIWVGVPEDHALHEQNSGARYFASLDEFDRALDRLR